MAVITPERFLATLAEHGIDDAALDTTLDEVRARFGVMAWGAATIACEVNYDAVLPNALLDSLDTVGDLYAFLEVRCGG